MNPWNPKMDVSKLGKTFVAESGMGLWSNCSPVVRNPLKFVFPPSPGTLNRGASSAPDSFCVSLMILM